MLAALAGCSDGDQLLTPQELGAAKAMTIDALAPLPPDPSNAVANSPQAVALGKALFNDTGFSRGGYIACASCHVEEQQFQDNLALGHGVGIADRRTMPLRGVAHDTFLFWDGRKDSLWSQALGPMENPVEHGATRTQAAQIIAAKYRPGYEALFGALPDLSTLPDSAGPTGTADEQAAWQALGAGERDSINRIYANIGKALAAYQRTLAPQPNRFDQVVRALDTGDAALARSLISDQEIAGFQLFTGRAECSKCHNGPRLTDDFFHNTGVPQASDLPFDHGRAAAFAKLDDDPFNCLGRYSDAKPEQCSAMRFMSRDTHEMERAFKVPSLRGVSGRPPYMHAGQYASLEDVLDHYSRAPEAPSGHSELNRLDLTEDEQAALLAFLRML